jgi:hypothetical protein
MIAGAVADGRVVVPPAMEKTAERPGAGNARSAAQGYTAKAL